MKKLLCLLLAALTSISVALGGCTAPQTEQKVDYTPIKNVILFIGDGMGFEHVKAAEIYASSLMRFNNFSYKLKSDTNNIMGTITDSAAGATALSTGVRTKNGHLGQDQDGYDLKTIMDHAKEEGKSTGIVTSDYLSGATPSAFSAHSFDRNDTFTIMNSQLTSGVDFFAADYSEFYANSLFMFENNGYACYDSLQNIDFEKKAFVMGEVEPDKTLPSDLLLEDMTTSAIEYLSRDEDGFTLMVEGAYIDKCSHGNDAGGMIKNLLAFNRAVKQAVSWAANRDDTVIIVTADHETGGLKVGEGATSQKLQTGNYSSLSWASEDHTAERVPLCVYSKQNYSLDGFSTGKKGEYLNNSDIFLFMLSCVKGEKITTVPDYQPF